MNIGERNEIIIKVKLIQLRDNQNEFHIDFKPFRVKSVGFNSIEYRKADAIDISSLLYADDAKLTLIARSLGIGKSPAGSKSDVYVNGKGYSLKSLQSAPPAIVNHTPRHGYETACLQSGADISLLDAIIDEYWKLRINKLIGEDVHSNSINSPFRNKKSELEPILNYFLFTGTGKGMSNHPADFILGYGNPLDFGTWIIYDKSNAVDKQWDRMVFSLRNKGMPANYGKGINKIRDISIAKWTRFVDGSDKGSLHIRTR